MFSNYFYAILLPRNQKMKGALKYQSQKKLH